MQSLNQEIQAANQVDWKKVREIICGMEASIKLICEMIPSGMIKTILCGIGSLLTLICKSLPTG